MEIIRKYEPWLSYWISEEDRGQAHAINKGFTHATGSIYAYLNTDEFFAEGFGQWSHSLMFDGVIKAWHLHRIQTDWWYVVSGVLRVGLCDMRPDSTTYKKVMDFLMGDLQPPRVVKIPPGVAHGCKTIQGPVNLFYMTSHIYNPEDEIRFQYNDPEIDFDWLKRPAIK